MDPYKNELNSIMWPCSTIFVIALVIGWCFMVVYDTAVDTIFLCFIIDEEMNGDQMMADADLKALVGKHEEDSKQLAARMYPDIHGETSDMKKAEAFNDASVGVKT